MLYIWNSDEENNTLREIHINTGTEKLSSVLLYSKKKIRFDSTLMIQADCHEKSAIEEQLSGIPICNHNIVTYRGDIALFVVDNLKI